MFYCLREGGSRVHELEPKGLHVALINREIKRKEKEILHYICVQRKICNKMKIGIAADHAGFDHKQNLVVQLREKGYDVTDYGAHQYDREDDYSDIVVPLAHAISKGEVEKGIAVCGSGVGVSIAANKIQGVRAALITDGYSAHQGVEHDDMNLICLGGRVLGPMMIWELIQVFLNAHFSGEERFQRRLEKVTRLEKKWN